MAPFPLTHNDSLPILLPTKSEFLSIHSNNIWICGGNSNGLILHSTDGGDSWTSEADTTLLNNHGLISISSPNQNYAWTIGSGTTVLGTSDGGNTWEEKSPEPGGISDGKGVCALDENTAWIAGSAQKILLMV